MYYKLQINIFVVFCELLVYNQDYYTNDWGSRFEENYQEFHYYFIESNIAGSYAGYWLVADNISNGAESGVPPGH